MSLEHSTWAINESISVDIAVGPGARIVLPRLVREAGRDYTSILIVADSGVPGRFVEDMVEAFTREGFRVEKLVVKGGEKAKSINTVVGLWEWLLKVGADRWSLLVAYGGGAVSDAAGFAAATYMRGIDWATVPTTLLSMADAAAGGKTAIDFNAKNIIGAFHHPRFIVADTEHLETLDERNYVSGLAEVVKHALLEGEWFLDWLRRNREAILARSHAEASKMIRMSLDTKMKIVARDYRERKGDRMLLNLGHTVAHAVEKATGYTVSHGEAVAIGLVVEAYAATRITGLPRSSIEEIRETLSLFGLPTRPPSNISADEAVKLMRLDKKRRGDKLTLPLLEAIGRPVLVDLRLDEAEKVLAEAWREAGNA
ncbi:3-dehydroquinate synthase family protein [Pyrofollis japonicus]|uniref:3-dehydroquinate synthase n=1 Tax=Pyrofollis japonicus TaxID=3060460 RepID=UPI00295BD9C6|nr:3-dehydroquinate synthase [Pyrofollis japonicus]BEP17823.1 3-dehydroquinate synthase family protein [Pyrofollis japonicus]